jgi:dTMP kinase
LSQGQSKKPRGKFITFEGIDGAGKSSHIESAAAFVRAQGRRVLTTREPGGTPLGEKLRGLLLHAAMHLETEALLMFAARREHLERVIEPALAGGDWVICDRFSDATFAYQCGGRGLDREKFAQLEQWVHAHLQPDLTLLFDLPAAIAAGVSLRRRVRATVSNRSSPIFTSGYARPISTGRPRHPERMAVIDADQSRDKDRGTGSTNDCKTLFMNILELAFNGLAAAAAHGGNSCRMPC